MQTDFNTIDVQASEWLARLDRSDTTEEERAAFERWRAADPRNAAAYARLDSAWSQLDRLRALRPAARGIDPNVLRPPSFATRRRWIALAAALLLALFAGWVALTRFTGSAYVTGVGGFQRLVLSDGSVLELNTSTRVRVSLGTSMRRVELLHGEASFDIAHDAARPFIVAVGDTAVRALGTRFNVRRFERSVEVFVNEGKVVVGAAGTLSRIEAPLPPSAPIVAAGHAAVVRAERVTLSEIAPAVAARKLAWQERMLVFDGTPLAEVVAEFNRYNERHLVLTDPSLAALRIGGYFRPTNLEAFVDVLEKHFDVHASSDRDHIVLSAARADAK